VQVSPAPGGGFQRFIAGLIGFTKDRITQQIYEGAYPRVQSQAVRGAKELSAERSAEAQASLNGQASQYLVGNNTAVYGPVAVTSMAMLSRPEYALVQGNLQYRSPELGQYADAGQPPELGTIASGVAADLHLPSLLTNFAGGYLTSPEVQGVDNILIETRDVPEGTPLAEAVTITPNADWPTFSQAVDRARAANNPKIQAVRLRKPARPPLFGADRDGNLVAVLRDVTIDLAAPAQGPNGVQIPGPPARVYRLTSPQLEIAIDGSYRPATAEEGASFQGQIVAVDPGAGAKITAIDQDENAGTLLNPLVNVVVLTAIRTRLQQRPVNLPLDRLLIPGFAFTGVTDLHPTGWLRVSLARTQ
jgi:hypothetical protein